MTRNTALLMVLAAMLPSAGSAQAKYRACADPVPNDAPPEVLREILRLRDASEVTRGYAAYELYKIGPKAAPAVPFLRHLLSDDSPLISHNTFANTKWQGPTCPGLLAAEALWAIRPEEITDVLKRDPAFARLNATRILAGMPHDRSAAAVLVLAARDASEEVRHAAVLGLGRSNSPDALEAVRDALADTSARIRARAVAALGKKKDAESLQAMLQVLAGDKDPWPRGFAAWYLGELNSNEAVAPLIRSLGDPSAYVRRYVASSLGILADGRAVEPLVPLVNDADAEVRREVGEALARFDDPRVAAAAVSNLSSSDASVRQRAVAAIGRYPDTYASHLIKALDDPDPKVRQEAVEALGWAESQAAPAAAALAGLLHNTSNRRFVSESTVFMALQRLGNAAVGDLEKILLAPPPAKRIGHTHDMAPRAARPLAEIGTPEATAALQAGLSAPSEAARREAQRLLKVRSYTRRPQKSARRESTGKPKPRRQPEPPHLAATHTPSGRPPTRAAAGARPAAGGPTGGGEGYRLTGVIGAVAIINGKTVRVGDTVNGAKVVKIGGMKVDLESAGRLFTIAVSTARK